VIGGFLRAAATDKFLRDANASPGQPVTTLTYLAGAKNTGNTREGIEKAVATAAAQKGLNPVLLPLIEPRSM
jgi:hypothetical protein